MKQITNIVTETYMAREGYRVDIVLASADMDTATLEAYLYNTEYGIKSLMFGVMQKNTDKSVFIDMVEKALDEYIAFYEEEYMD